MDDAEEKAYVRGRNSAALWLARKALAEVLLDPPLQKRLQALVVRLEALHEAVLTRNGHG